MRTEFFQEYSRGASPVDFAKWMLFPAEFAAADGKLDDFKFTMEYVVRGGVSLVGYRGKDN